MAETSTRLMLRRAVHSPAQTVQTLLDQAGITLNGPDPWDIHVRDESIYRRLLIGGSLALGESYMDGKWEVKALDEMIYRLLRSPLANERAFVPRCLSRLRSKLFNLQKQSRAFQVGEGHYDLGNDIYETMLDRRMTYTCGYWRHADNLNQAQEDKLELVCRKLKLTSDMRVLDIGCGWGSFAGYAAEKYGCEVVGVTVSKEQVQLVKKRLTGLPVSVRLQDYRDVHESFDAIVSLGMFEHVGHKNYRIFMDILLRCLKPDGVALLHTIGKNDSVLGVDPWIARYIFPNGEIPSLQQISAALEPDLVVEDLHNFGPDYDRTLMNWYHNFDSGWDSLKDRYSERFYRMWTYYLRVCAGAFRARNLQLWQFVLSRGRHSVAYRRPDF